MAFDPAKFEGITHLVPPIRAWFKAGAAAGNHTVTGIKAQDKLISVLRLRLSTLGQFSSQADITSEFTITADNTCNNTGGSNTTSQILLFLWADYDKT